MKQNRVGHVPEKKECVLKQIRKVVFCPRKTVLLNYV